MQDHASVLPRRHQGRFIDQVGQIGAREARGSAGDGLHIHIGRQGHVLHVNAQNAFATADIGITDHNLTVETTRAKQGRVEDVGTVG